MAQRSTASATTMHPRRAVIEYELWSSPTEQPRLRLFSSRVRKLIYTSIMGALLSAPAAESDYVRIN